MRRSLEDIRRHYGKKNGHPGRDNTSSRPSDGPSSDGAIKEDDPPSELKATPQENGLVSFLDQPPSIADFTKVDFSGSVIANELGKIYANETVFNVFSNSVCNSSILFDSPPKEFCPLDDKITQSNREFSETDFSSRSADKNYNVSSGNASASKQFLKSLSFSDTSQGAANTACHASSLAPPTGNQLQTHGSELVSRGGVVADITYEMGQQLLQPTDFSNRDILNQSGLRNSNSAVDTGFLRMSYGSFQKLMDQSVKPNQCDVLENPNEVQDIKTAQSSSDCQAPAEVLGSNQSASDISLNYALSANVQSNSTDAVMSGLGSLETASSEPNQSICNRPTIPKNASQKTYDNRRETLSTCLIPGTIELPRESKTVGLNIHANCVDETEINGLPKPQDYIEHDWLIQKIHTIKGVLGTSGCGYLGEVHNNKMHGQGRFYFDKDQYIQGKWEMNTLIEHEICHLAIESFRCTISVVEAPNIYLVSILDEYNFVAKATPSSLKELDFTTSVTDLKVSFIKRFEIIEIIHDELKSKRIASQEKFKTALELLTSEDSDVEKNSTIIFLLSKYSEYTDDDVLASIKENQVFPASLRASADNLLRIETAIKLRNEIVHVVAGSDEIVTNRHLKDIMFNTYKNRVVDHRRSLLSKCPNAFIKLKEIIHKLPCDKVLYITREDIGVFDHLSSVSCAEHSETHEYSQSFIKRFIDGFEKKMQSIDTKICPSVIIPVISPISGYLYKSFSEIAGEIISKAESFGSQDMFRLDRAVDWDFEIKWSLEHETSHLMNCRLLKVQYFILSRLMHIFASGTCEMDGKNSSFMYKFHFLKFNPLWRQQVPNDSSELIELENLEGLSNERLTWLFILDKAIYLPFKDNLKILEAIKQYDSLLQANISFFQNPNLDSHELFRVVTNSIIRFVINTLPYAAESEDKTAIDSQILNEQMRIITRTFHNFQGYTNFRDLIEELNRYWTLRRFIEVKLLRQPLSYFTNCIVTMLEDFFERVVSPSIRKEVPIVNLVQYLRSLNDFIDDFKDIDFLSCWYVKSDVYDGTVMEKIDNILSCSQNCSYRVTNIDGFIKLVQGKPVPEHYILEVVRLLIRLLSRCLNCPWNVTVNHLRPNSQPEPPNTVSPKYLSWNAIFAHTVEYSEMATHQNKSATDSLESTGLLLDSIRRSFMYMKEQPEYVDFEAFKKESLAPFIHLVFESTDLNEFKNRTHIIKESFWYIRNMNEIGIDQAITLFANENDCDTLEKLKDTYNLYFLLYERLIGNYCRHLQHGSSHRECLEIVSQQVLKVSEVLHFSNWTEAFKTEVIPKLLAGISAVWSIQMSKDVSSTEKFIKPHCIQILCILRLLSVDKPKGAENHFAQIKTGQGKSLILGILSAILALTGHKVRIVCYSKYLSERDEKDFKNFYQFFDIADAISYGTFDDMASGFLKPLCNGVQTDLRKIIRQRVLLHADPRVVGSIHTGLCDTVLLIDEVDVFFNDRLYGNCYESLTTVQIQGLAQIQYAMWKIVKGSNYDAVQVKSLTEMHIANKIKMGVQSFLEWEAFCAKPGTIHLLVDDPKYGYRIEEYTNRSLANHHLLMMATDAIRLARDIGLENRFKLDREGRVCMKNSSGQYVPTSMHSYLNAFASIELGGSDYLPACSFSNYGYFLLRTGKISYARLPCQFPLIMGVSGTLKDLSEYEKRGIDSYNIKTFSILPSFFGKSNLKFDENDHFTYVLKQQDWLSCIHHVLNETVQRSRAALVFFDSDVRLDLFARECTSKFSRVNQITSNTDSHLRDQFINEAGTPCTVTLATRAMGRGVDYKSSLAVEKKGGVQVIQTFFSEDVKEEIQLRGRTARKDNLGSYRLIICKEHLVQTGIVCSNSQTELTYSTLQSIRRKLMNTIGERHAKMIKKSEHDHDITMIYYGYSLSDKTLSDASVNSQ